jgi:hypothetical protein
MAQIEIGANLAGILERVLNSNHVEIREILGEIMSAQEDFDAKITRANAALDEVAAAVAAEAAQIAEFIAANPSVNTEALEGVVARLEGASESVAGVFEPPAPEPDPEPEPEPEPPQPEEPEA